MRKTTTIIALSLLAACASNNDAIVVVDVTASAPLPGIAKLVGSVVAGGKSAPLTIKPANGASSFAVDPMQQTFGIQIPRGVTGAVHVHLGAVDTHGETMATGDGSATIAVGARVDLPLVLVVPGTTATDMGPGGPQGDMAMPAAATLTADRAQQSFGSVTVAHTSSPVQITITNVGGDATGALTLATSGTDADQFAVTTDCAASLLAGDTCHVSAQFKPTSTGGKQAHFDVTAMSGARVGVDVTGTGTPPGTITISPDNGSCGSALLHQPSTTTAMFTVKNIGTTATPVPTVITSDPQFVAGGCANALMPNDTCMLTVTFTPTARGQQTASVSVTGTPDNIANASLTGTGLQPATLKITSPTGSFSLGSAPLSGSGTTITFSVTNSGDVASEALMPSAIAGSGLANSSPTSFSKGTDTCSGAMVQPNTSCSVDVQLTPTQTGSLSASLQAKGASGVLASATLTGTGTPPGTLSIAANAPANGSCGASVLGTPSTTMATYTVTNVGTSATGLPMVMTSDQQFVASGCTKMLQPNEQCTITVTFTPKNRGLQSATVSVTATPGGTAPANVSGTGQLAATFQLTAMTSFDFGSAARGTSGQKLTFIATNQGDVMSPVLSQSNVSGNDFGSWTRGTTDTCNTKQIPAGGNCQVSWQFTPQRAASLSTTLEILSGSTVLTSGTLTGTGTPTWVREYSASSTNGQGLTGVFASGSHVWAVGYNGAFIGRNGDGSWSDHNVGTATNFYLLTGTGGTDMWLVAPDEVLHSSGDGTTTNVEGLPVGSSTSMSGLVAFAPNDVWVLVSTSGSSPSEAFYHYTGGPFLSTSATVNYSTSFMWGTSDAKIWAAETSLQCFSGSCNETIGLETGSTTSGFNKLEYGPFTYGFPGPALGPIWGTSATDIYCAVSGTRPLHSKGDGAWVAVDPSAPSNVAAIWGSGSTDIYFGSGAGLYHGDGSTWSSTPFTGGKKLSVAGISGTGPNDVYAVGNDSDGACVYHYF